jgi:hypothetical protein
MQFYISIAAMFNYTGTEEACFNYNSKYMLLLPFFLACLKKERRCAVARNNRRQVSAGFMSYTNLQETSKCRVHELHEVTGDK